EAFLTYMQGKAPHIHLERGLENHIGRLSGLDEVGTSDLANAGVLAMWLTRKFPPQPKVAKQQQQQTAPPPSRAAQTIDVAVDHRRAARDLHAALPQAVHEQDLAALPPPPPPPKQERVSWRDTIRTPEQQEARKKKLIAAAVVAVLLAGGVAFTLLHTPE